MGIHYLYDPINGQVDRELDDNGNVLVEYTREPDGTLLSEHRNGVSKFYHFDGAGNTTALTDINGEVTDTFEYNAFGEETARTGTTPTPFRYHGAQGYYLDLETGDYLAGVRQFSPKRGRWYSVDPLELIEGTNLYEYARNNPVLRVDPTGMLSYDDVEGPADPTGKRPPAHSSGDCGAFAWYITWNLKETVDKFPDGYIIQQITMRSRVHDCCDKITPMTGICSPRPAGGKGDPALYQHIYYEIWKVKGGKVYLDADQKDPTKLADPYHDVFSLGGRDQTKGCHTTSGEGIFVTKLVGIDNLKPAGVGSAGVLFSVCDLPKGVRWADLKAGVFRKGKVAKRVQEAQWNCCRDDKSTTEKHGTETQLDNKCAKK